MNEATPVHELLHTCGFQHEHNRYDRDEWIRIYWDNIMEGYESNFKRESPLLHSDYGVPYNYDSVMHYPLNAFGKSRNTKTMENLVSENQRCGIHNYQQNS